MTLFQYQKLHSIELKGKIIMNNDLVRIWKQTSIACSYIEPALYFLGDYVKHDENLRQLIFQLKSEQDTSLE
jgi:hypothetical protein